jgi:hypothetical protein
MPGWETASAPARSGKSTTRWQRASEWTPNNGAARHRGCLTASRNVEARLRAGDLELHELGVPAGMPGRVHASSGGSTLQAESLRHKDIRVRKAG